jgi:hypothetical protein
MFSSTTRQGRRSPGKAGLVCCLLSCLSIAGSRTSNFSQPDDFYFGETFFSRSGIPPLYHGAIPHKSPSEIYHILHRIRACSTLIAIGNDLYLESSKLLHLPRCLFWSDANISWILLSLIGPTYELLLQYVTVYGPTSVKVIDERTY